MNIWPHIINSTSHLVSDDNSTEFRYYEWVREGIKFCNEVTYPSSIVNDHRVVKDFLCDNGKRDINNLNNFLPSDIINKIRAIASPSNLDDPDSFTWTNLLMEFFQLKVLTRFLLMPSLVIRIYGV